MIRFKMHDYKFSISITVNNVWPSRVHELSSPRLSNGRYVQQIKSFDQGFWVVKDVKQLGDHSRVETSEIIWFS